MLWCSAPFSTSPFKLAPAGISSPSFPPQLIELDNFNTKDTTAKLCLLTSVPVTTMMLSRMESWHQPRKPFLKLLVWSAPPWVCSANWLLEKPKPESLIASSICMHTQSIQFNLHGRVFSLTGCLEGVTTPRCWKPWSRPNKVRHPQDWRRAWG